MKSEPKIFLLSYVFDVLFLARFLLISICFRTCCELAGFLGLVW